LYEWLLLLSCQPEDKNPKYQVLHSLGAKSEVRKVPQRKISGRKSSMTDASLQKDPASFERNIKLTGGAPTVSLKEKRRTRMASAVIVCNQSPEDNT
jgi:hypothetical protein